MVDTNQTWNSAITLQEDLIKEFVKSHNLLSIKNDAMKDSIKVVEAEIVKLQQKRKEKKRLLKKIKKQRTRFITKIDRSTEIIKVAKEAKMKLAGIDICMTEIPAAQPIKRKHYNLEEDNEVTWTKKQRKSKN